VITFNWVYELPFGKGKTFAGSSGSLLDALIGGWQFSGLNRWSSAFPFSVIDTPGLHTELSLQQTLTVPRVQQFSLRFSF
jgi:hypothetical protein